MPGAWSWFQQPKSMLSEVLKRIGLAQGEWVLFAPNPDVDNGWLSAEIINTNQQSHQWLSPIWDQHSVWNKFYRFRHMNFYNRLANSRNLSAWDEFADFLVRQYRQQNPQEIVRQVSLFRNSMKMLPLPGDITMPTPDDITWMTSNEFLTRRTYQP